MDQSTSSSSGRSGGDYPATLIGTVAELRMELQRTMAEIHATKEQNRILQSNNQGIKDELLETRKKYAEAYENYMSTVTEKLEAESQNEAFMERLKRQLNEKTKEFDLLRDKNSPQDIDTIRIKVQEELEIPHREKLAKLQHELQEQKVITFKMKRDIEVAKTEFDLADRSHRMELGALKVQHEQVEKRLRDEIIKLQEREFLPERDEQTMRMQEAQLSELKHIVDRVREEAVTMRQMRDDAVHAMEQSEARREETSIHLRARVATADSERLALEHRLAAVLADADRREGALRVARHNEEQMSIQLEVAKRHLTDLESKLASEIVEHTSEVQDLKQRAETDRQDLEQQVSSLSDRCHDREEHVRRAQRTATEIQMRAESVETELRKANQQLAHELNRRIAHLEMELAEEKALRKTAEYQSRQTTEDLTTDVEVQRSELARLQREKDVLHDRLREMESKLESEKKAGVLHRREAGAKLQASDHALTDLRQRAMDLEGRLLKSKSADLDHQYTQQALQAKLDAAVAEHAALLEAVKAEAALRVSEMDRTYAEKLEQIKQRSREEIEKQKKRAEAYKGKAEEAQKRGKALTQTALDAAASSYGLI